MPRIIFILMTSAIIFSCQSDGSTKQSSANSIDQNTSVKGAIDQRTSGKDHSVNYKPIEESIDRPIRNVSVHMIKNKIEYRASDYLLLDVRTKEQYDSGHIPTAEWADIMKIDQFKEQIKNLKKDQTYYIYSTEGSKSAIAYAIMHDMGFTNIFDIPGGYKAWTELEAENDINKNN